MTWITDRFRLCIMLYLEAFPINLASQSNNWAVTPKMAKLKPTTLLHNVLFSPFFLHIVPFYVLLLLHFGVFCPPADILLVFNIAVTQYWTLYWHCATACPEFQKVEFPSWQRLTVVEYIQYKRLVLLTLCRLISLSTHWSSAKA